MAVNRVSLFIEGARAETETQEQHDTGGGGETLPDALRTGFVFRDLARVSSSLIQLTSIMDFLYLTMKYLGSRESGEANLESNVTYAIPRRRNSTDTMSTVIMPPLLHGLVDWAETHRQRDIMG